MTSNNTAPADGARGKQKAIRTVCAVLMAVYSLWMLYLLFIRYRRTASAPAEWGVDVKLIPFVTTAEFIGILRTSEDAGVLRHGIRNLAGNVALFVPYGFFLPFFFGKCEKYGRTLLCAAGGIIIIELAQLITRRGICDIDDLIFNLVGVSLGFGLYRLYGRTAAKRASAKNGGSAAAEGEN